VTDESIDWVEALAAYRQAADRERARPVLGSTERPYKLLVPAWVEARAREEGTTCQEVADRIFLPAVRVTVIEDYGADPS
jgi:hypothetical protein